MSPAAASRRQPPGVLCHVARYTCTSRHAHAPWRRQEEAHHTLYPPAQPSLDNTVPLISARQVFATPPLTLPSSSRPTALYSLLSNATLTSDRAACPPQPNFTSPRCSAPTPTCVGTYQLAPPVLVQSSPGAFRLNLSASDPLTTRLRAPAAASLSHPAFPTRMLKAHLKAALGPRPQTAQPLSRSPARLQSTWQWDSRFVGARVLAPLQPSKGFNVASRCPTQRRRHTHPSGISARWCGGAALLDDRRKTC